MTRATEESGFKITRRAFLTWAAMGSAAAYLQLHGGSLVSSAFAAPQTGELIIPTASNFDCGGKCLNKAHVLDGVITRISTRTNDELNPTMPVMKGCVRGRSYRKFQYHPDRLKYPMKRVGKRGDGKFERISWDEAIDIIARRTAEITEKYGPDSRFMAYGTGTSMGSFNLTNLGKRFLNATGGFLDNYHNISMGNINAATMYTYGTANSGSTMDTLAHSKLIILWGHNPVETHFGHTNHYLKQAKENGCKFIVIDPRYSDSVITYADEWIPILPGTDNALMDAMAYVIVTENLHDRAFLDKYCLGFDGEHMPEGVPAEESYLAFLMGEKDGVVKTPEWAEKICKVKANVIWKLAVEYASAKPAALLSGWGMGRQSSGERATRGSAMLCCMTGNVGKLGGWAGAYGGIARPQSVRVPILKNSVPQTININQWLDLIEDYNMVKPEGGLKGADKLRAPIKMLLSISGNYTMCMNADINRARRLLEDDRNVEFIVASDLFMTPTCQYADIVLPSTSFFESWDLSFTFNCGAYFILTQKVVEPMFEARHPYEWMVAVCRKLGVEDTFSEGRTQKEWVMHLLDETRKADSTVPSWEQMQKQGIHYFQYQPLNVAFKKQIEQPESNRFQTPSGKIELCSKRLYELHDPEVPATAHYVPAWEGPEDKLTAKFPYQIIGWRNKNRDNSTFYNHPWLQQVSKQVMWIHPHDAAEKGIKQGDRVRVFNDRGALFIEAHITERIMPGVLAIPTGAWYSPDKDGTDKNGCLNVLTPSRQTPLAKGNAHQTCLADIIVA